MSRFCVALVAVVLMSALSSAVEARELFGLGPLGAVAHLFGGGLSHRARMHHRVRPTENAAVAPQQMPAATNQRTGDEKLAVGSLLTAPETRRQIAANAALALWHGERNAATGWWSHGHGGYGWVGPLFWPFAYNDIYGYTIFGDGMGFPDYGYPDLYAGIFAPYSSDELAAYMKPGSSRRRERRVPPLSQFCNEAEQGIAGLVIDRIRRAVDPTDEQRAALDRLADASNSAAAIIQASCPTEPAATAPGRLAAMQQRVAAMLKAVIALEPPLQELYAVLNDDQKNRLNALRIDQLKVASADGSVGSSAQGCTRTVPAALQWPAAEIESGLHPNEAQREALQRLQRASADALDMLSYECQPVDANTPSDRLAAVDRRLDALQDAINLVSLALDDVYATLDDEQKARFELIGPQRAP